MPACARRGIALVTILALLSSVGLPATAVVAAPEDTDLESQFDQIQSLRANGEFDRAIVLLSNIIAQHEQSVDTLRRAYTEIVATYLFKQAATNDLDEQDALYAEARQYAEKAIERFPDLKADPRRYPPEINNLFDTRRELMYGQVEVTATPDSCRVFLDDDYKGTTPLTLKFVRVGDYSMTVARSGYKDKMDALSVQPSSLIQRDVQLSKARSRGWWLTRVVAPIVLSAALVTALVVGGDDGGTTPPAEPLPGPPAPPTR